MVSRFALEHRELERYSLSPKKYGIMNRISRAVITSIFLISSIVLNGQEIPKPMYPPRLVNDFAQILNPQESNRLEQKLRNYHDTTTTQLYVVTIPDLQGYDIADYAFRLGEQWGVGQKGMNNGAVILIKPQRGNERGEMMIAIGYGLEDVIPDATAKRIVEREMLPYFQENLFYRGIDAATTTMIGLASGKFTAGQYADQGEPSGAYMFLFLLVFFFVFLLNAGRARRRSIGRNIPFWLAMGMLAGAGRRGGGFGNFSSGSGSFGGFGGFSGGGGGSFGGGGARGSW